MVLVHDRDYIIHILSANGLGSLTTVSFCCDFLVLMSVHDSKHFVSVSVASSTAAQLWVFSDGSGGDGGKISDGGMREEEKEGRRKEEKNEEE